MREEWHNLIKQAKQQGITTQKLMEWFETVKNRTVNAAK